MKIIIESTDIDSFKDVITTFYHAFNTPAMKAEVPKIAPPEEPQPEQEAEPEENEPTKKVTRKKPGRKAKSKIEITEQTDVQEEVVDLEADADDTKKPEASAMEIDPPEKPKEKAATAITKEAVFAALKKVSSTKGMIEARALLERFEASRISELKEEQYKSFIDACERLAR